MIHAARRHLAARRIPEALRAFAQCDFDDSAGDLWYCHMLAGDFASAWRTADEIERRSPSRVWNGEWFTGRRVLIRCVHGLGDAIQFIRYARELKQAGAASVVAQMHPELVDLHSTAPGLDRAITWGPRPEFDIEIEVMELAWAFRHSCEDLPRETPYLFVPPRRLAERALRFRNSNRPRVALVWHSSPWDETRSIPLHLFESAFAPLAGIDFHSLQHGPAHAQAAGRGWLNYSGEQSGDILDTAADIMNSDLLITPDTMAAHLAGALGKPVWVLLKHDADWRWMMGRCDSPWYPSMRLFRQPRAGDWESPLRAAAQALREISRDPYPGASSRTPDSLSLS